MKKLLKVLGIIALIAVIGFGCSNSGGGGNGKKGPGSGDGSGGNNTVTPVDRAATDGKDGGSYVSDVFNDGSTSGSTGSGGSGDSTGDGSGIGDGYEYGDGSTGGNGDGLGNGGDPNRKNPWGGGSKDNGRPSTGGDAGDSGGGSLDEDGNYVAGSGGGGKTAGTKDEDGNVIGNGGDNGGHDDNSGNGYGGKTDLLPIVFEYIPAGFYNMGGSGENNPGYGEVTPVQDQRVEAFYITRFELTQEQFYVVTGKNPSQHRHQRNLPVDYISFYDVAVFCNKLTEMDMGKDEAYYTINTVARTVTENTGKKGYRLPTEIEWEYACRATTTTDWNTGSSISLNQANFGAALPQYGGWLPGALGKTVPVAAYASNAWKLYNMHGNVGEWVYGFADRTYIDGWNTAPQNPPVPVARGGEFKQYANSLRSWSRGTLLSQVWNGVGYDGTEEDYGIRVARTSF